MDRVALYYHTIRNMKPSQLFNRIRIKLGMGCRLGAIPTNNWNSIVKVESPESLDFDSVFLARFPVEKLMENEIFILHSCKKIIWKSRWKCEDKSALWNFNLHYFEYLFPLIKRWKETGEKRYLDKTVEMIEGWIEHNPIGTDPAWASYPTAIRIVAWISYYGYVEDELGSVFREKFIKSLHQQYTYLVGHLEKDLLGNHYFEDLKSLIIASLFFKDITVLDKALINFKAECKEQILSDGMHFELSPMYHKIIFEGIVRVAIALKGAGRRDREIEFYIQPMLDVAYSFEKDIDRVPLFNDGGNNVAKSNYALQSTVQQYFDIKPHYKKKMDDSGFYIFEKEIKGKKWKMIVDAGQPGPKYIPGHAHCDAMSYELFCNGKPVVVNCGTYAYQCRERDFFRSTSAHNTVMVKNVEQSQFWGVFRLAKRSKTKVLYVTDDSITMEMLDQRGNRIKRIIQITAAGMVVKDFAKCPISSFVHLTSLGKEEAIISSNSIKEKMVFPYAEDYGFLSAVKTLKFSSKSPITVYIDFVKLI